MIKTLRITSVAAVILAAVVLASVLGFLRPDSLLPLRVGTGSDKQTESILKGPSAVERFKTQGGPKDGAGDDKTPPLIKQAEVLAGIINPPDLPPVPGGGSGIKNPSPPRIPIKPPVAVSSKFNLVATSCCSSNPKLSYAHIRLPGDVLQWVGVGEQVGHVTIKEIRKDSVLCWDGKNDSEVTIDAVPETSSLLETAKASDGASGTKVEAAPNRSEPAAVTVPPVKANSLTPSGLAKPLSSAARTAIVASQGVLPGTPVPSAQITKQEQEKLSRLGDRLKSRAGLDSAGQAEAANRLINEFKSAQNLPPGVKELGDAAESDPGPETWKDARRAEERRKYYSGRLTPPRAPKD